MRDVFDIVEMKRFCTRFFWNIGVNIVMTKVNWKHKIE